MYRQLVKQKESTVTALGNLEQKQLLASPSKQNSSMALRMDDYPVADKGDEQPR